MRLYREQSEMLNFDIKCEQHAFYSKFAYTVNFATVCFLVCPLSIANNKNKIYQLVLPTLRFFTVEIFRFFAFV
jgi:hypothetical protein